MKKIAVITATRAEFGLLLPVVRKLREYENNEFKVELIVTGTHLDKKYGNTVDEIKNLNVRIDKQIPVSVNSETQMDISLNQADVLSKFTELFISNGYEGIVILGDRYEMLSVAIAAGNTHTPIFHLCGGDTTEGAIDEWIRHSISKMSYMHFVTNFESYKRVIQLGEQPDKVFNYGSTSVDNIYNMAVMDKIEVLNSIGLDNCNYAICTYHPVTMENEGVEGYVNSFLEAVSEFSDIDFIITKSNADHGGAEINKILDEADNRIKNIHVYSSLGVVRYLSLMKNALFVLGNSSSGIIEAPAFRIPTINIGDRQKGRLRTSSIINCSSDKESIIDSINKALSDDFREICKKADYPYGNGDASDKIAAKIYEVVNKGNINLKKKFYDISNNK